MRTDLHPWSSTPGSYRRRDHNVSISWAVSAWSLPASTRRDAIVSATRHADAGSGHEPRADRVPRGTRSSVTHNQHRPSPERITVRARPSQVRTGRIRVRSHAGSSLGSSTSSTGRMRVAARAPSTFPQGAKATPAIRRAPAGEKCRPIAVEVAALGCGVPPRPLARRAARQPLGHDPQRPRLAGARLAGVKANPPSWTSLFDTPRESVRSPP